MIALALVVATVTTGVAVAVVVAVRALPTVRLQLAALAFCSVVLPLTVVLLSGWVMFHMGDDVKILAVSTAAASAAIAAGLLLGHSLADRIEQLRMAAREFARGDLAARVLVTKPAELADLSVSFNDMASRLEALFDSRSELVAWASHDLRTPIASLKAMVEALEDGVAEPAEYLPGIKMQIVTLELLVEDLFEVASIDSGALTLELCEVELSSLVRSCLESLAATAAAAGVRLDLAGDEAAYARCAPDKVERVMRNLLANAVRHTPNDGSVVVSVAVENGYVGVTVEDTGDGLPPEVRARMFERFWRGDAARTRDGAGAGLGLTIARGLIQAQGGDVWAAPRESGGAAVGFTLPRA